MSLRIRILLPAVVAVSLAGLPLFGASADPVTDPGVSIGPVDIPTITLPEPTPTPTETPTPTLTPTPTPTPTQPSSTPPTRTSPTPAPSVSHTPVPHPHKPPVVVRPHPHKAPVVVRPHPHKTPGPVAPKRAHPHRQSWPITVTVKTVPALKGVAFRFDGHAVTTNAAGIGSYTAQHDYLPHALTLVSRTVSNADQRFEFNRWAGQRKPEQAFLPTVTSLPLRADYTVTAGFSVDQQVAPVFREPNGQAPSTYPVSSATLKSDTGQLITLAQTGPTWLAGLRPVFHHSTLAVEPVTYSLQSVMVRGANVVDAGRQSFQPVKTRTPVFQTQFHDLTITAHDALFGTARGAEATVVFPDGRHTVVALGTRHSVVLPALPRGTYSVVLKTGAGIAAADEFTLSKDKTSDVAVISALDLSVLGVLGVLVAVALLLIGRSHWRNRLVRRFRRALSENPHVPDYPVEVLS